MDEEKKNERIGRMKIKRAEVKAAVRQNVKKLKDSAATKLTPKKLKLLVTIVNKNKAEFYVDLLQSFEINMQICMLAEGTATSETKHVLGLEDSARMVILSVIREDKATEALKKLDEKFQTIRNGKGIAYTIPMTSVVGVAIYQFLSNNRMSKEGK